MSIAMITILKRISLIAAAFLVAIAAWMPQTPTLRCRITHEIIASCCCGSMDTAMLGHQGVPSYGQPDCCCEVITPAPRPEIQAMTLGRVNSGDFIAYTTAVVEILDDRRSLGFCIVPRAQKIDRAKIALGQRPSYEWFCSYLM
jgi:hypothetical protein